MKKHFLFLILLLASLARPAFAQSTALELNDRIAAITDSLYARGQAWGNAFMTARSTRDFSSLKPIRTGIQKFIKSRLKEVSRMKDINGSRPLRDAMISFLKVEQHMVSGGFIPVERLKSGATDLELEQAIQQLADASSGEAEALKRLNDAQTEYASKNGFRIKAE